MTTRLSSLDRVRYTVALVVLAGFSLLSGVGLGVSVHGVYETRESLAHWRARAAEPEAQHALPMDRPAARVERLESQLAAQQERAAVCGVMLLLFGVVTILGVRSWRKLVLGPE